MNIKKIALYEIQTSRFHIYKSKYSYTPRLGLCVIANKLAQCFSDIKVDIFLGELASGWSLRGWLRKIFRLKSKNEDIYTELMKADIVGISALTMNVNEAYDLARRMRREGFKGKLIIGGAHVTFHPAEPFRHRYDYVARYAGEGLMVELIEALREERGEKRLFQRLRRIQGLSFRWGKKIHHNPVAKERPRKLNWGAMDYSLFKGIENTVPLATSISCPHKCRFCSVVTQWGGYKERPLEDVITEWRQIKKLRETGQLSPTATIFITDDNFLPYPHKKERVIKFLNMLIDEGLNEVGWNVQVTANTGLDLDFLKLMKRAGVRWVFIGFESINPTVLKEANKASTAGINIEGARNFRKVGISVHGMFVAGFDSDTVASINDNLEFALENVDTAQFLILTPLLGTPLYEEYKKKRIVDHNWGHYDAMHITYTPKNFRRHEFFDQILRAYKRFYSLRTLLRTAMRRRNWTNNILLMNVWGYFKVREWNLRQNRSYRKQLRLEHFQEELRHAFYTGYNRYRRILRGNLRRLEHKWDDRMSSIKDSAHEIGQRGGEIYEQYTKSLQEHFTQWRRELDAKYKRKERLGRKKGRRAKAYYKLYLGKIEKEDRDTRQRAIRSMKDRKKKSAAASGK